MRAGAVSKDAIYYLSGARGGAGAAAGTRAVLIAVPPHPDIWCLSIAARSRNWRAQDLHFQYCFDTDVRAGLAAGGPGRSSARESDIAAKASTKEKGSTASGAGRRGGRRLGAVIAVELQKWACEHT